jgi:hypothetical protein
LSRPRWRRAAALKAAPIVTVRQAREAPEPAACPARAASATRLSAMPYHDTLQTNLGNQDSLDGGAAPTLGFDSAEGSPTPGSLKVTVPFSGPNQYVDVQSLVFLVPQDWSGHTLHARVKVDAGSTFRGFAQLYVDTGVSYVPADSNVNLAPGSQWQDIAIDLSHPMTTDPSGRFNPKQVVLYGLQLNSGSASATPATFHLDSFSLE